MTKVKIPGGTSTYYAVQSDTTYTMAANKTIDAMAYGIDVQGTANGRILEIAGKVEATISAIRIGSEGVTGAVELDLGKTGWLNGDAYGLELGGHGNIVRNAGRIHGSASGIITDGEQTVVNHGMISGGDFGINIRPGEGDTFTVRNAGTIKGGDKAIFGAATEDIVINTGKLKGDVDLAGGNDAFYFNGGSVTGTVLGGDGDDNYYLRKTGLEIVENFGKGMDTVYTSVSHALEANVENLMMLGKKDINGTGSGLNNQMHGNAGDNRLSGGYGYDILNGNGGNDVLSGGASPDEFYFQVHTGKDTITDFEIGIDRIEANYLKGASDFEDMIAQHTKMKHGDTWITYGSDILVLEDIDMNDLQKGDFSFY